MYSTENISTGRSVYVVCKTVAGTTSTDGVRHRLRGRVGVRVRGRGRLAYAGSGWDQGQGDGQLRFKAKVNWSTRVG